MLGNSFMRHRKGEYMRCVDCDIEMVLTNLESEDTNKWGSDYRKLTVPRPNNLTDATDKILKRVIDVFYDGSEYSMREDYAKEIAKHLTKEWELSFTRPVVSIHVCNLCGKTGGEIVTNLNEILTAVDTCNQWIQSVVDKREDDKKRKKQKNVADKKKKYQKQIAAMEKKLKDLEE